MRPDPGPWAEGTPTGRKFPFQKKGGVSTRNKIAQILQRREQLDALTVKDVIFYPYEHIVSSVSTYNGPLYHAKGFVMYNPRRVLRQLGCKQTIVKKEAFKLLKSGSHLDKSNIRLNYDPTPDVEQWNERGEEKYQVLIVDDIVGETKEAEEGYLAWFNRFGHPSIQNRDPDALEYLRKKEAAKKKKQASKKGLLDVDWKELYNKMVRTFLSCNVMF